VRIEDIDPPREQVGATAEILRALECYGFEWDGPVVYQSHNRAAHDEALRSLLERGLAYPCGCSRKDLADMPRGPLGIIYPGTCRAGCSADETAIRVRTEDEPISFDDLLQGPVSQRLESESGDFVIRRRDGLIAYQLAVVVDDELQGITQVVRGIDIIDSTPRQIWLQRLLGYRQPEYAHIPVVTHPDGDKLSKLTGAPAIPLDDVRPTLVAALEALQQEPPRDLTDAALAHVWKWALTNWKIQSLQGLTEVRVDRIYANCLTVTPHLQ
jgi:glutamyl-Q tRNA(Asp) synthetase